MARADRRPRRRLAVAERREEILAAAGEVFGARAYPDVSVAAIAERAGTSEATIHHYFDGKAGLYIELIRRDVENLLARQEAEDATLGPRASARDRVRTSLHVYLDLVAEHPHAWAAPYLVAGNDPPAAATLRGQIRADYVERLRAILLPDQGVRHEFALWGYFGFLDAALLQWVEQGCPNDQREPLVAAVLGALEGALGDWGR